MNKDIRKIRPTDIEVDRTANELVIRWNDDHVSRFSLEVLRRTCPCAQCQEKRLQTSTSEPGQLILLDDDAATATAEVRKVNPVGRYGLRITWADGHNYGIYTFEALRLRDEGVV